MKVKATEKAKGIDAYTLAMKYGLSSINAAAFQEGKSIDVPDIVATGLSKDGLSTKQTIEKKHEKDEVS